MNASVLASSHIDHHILWPVNESWVSDLANYQFVFLQHGVTKDDISGWLNEKPIRLFVTATVAEADSIRAEQGPYKFSDREVILTGFSRHDALLTKAQGVDPNRIVIMPTWRSFLVDQTKRRGVDVEGTGIAEISQSQWAQSWLGLLNNENLRRAAVKNQLEILWAPHPGMAIYLNELKVPDWVTAVDVRSSDFQQILCSAKVAITDYSSVAFEFAYLNRPVVYFHFDTEGVAEGKRLFRQGYYSYAKDGFGPVCRDPDEVARSVEQALVGLEDSCYQQRRLDSLPYRDGKCSERIVSQILKVVPHVQLS
jgi:hypothetical protein